MLQGWVKTITSKMLVLYFAGNDYKVRYTTNGVISDIKQSLSINREDKEIILLDDCLGQHYFKMNDTQENELISLIKYIKMNRNKKLIMNSRVTIFNESMNRSQDFDDFINIGDIKIHTINMDLITKYEKAKIFYNHLVLKKIPTAYFDNIVEQKRYLNVVVQ